MDNFNKAKGPQRRPMVSRGSTRQMPASRPSVVEVPPAEQQLADIPVSPEAEQLQETPVPKDTLQQLDLEVQEARYPRRYNWVKRMIVSLVTLGVTALLGALVWYGVQLMPVDGQTDAKVAVKITAGSTPDEIAAQLKQGNVIRSELAFLLTARFKGVQGSLQAGVYRIAPSESLFEVIDHLVKGRTDTFDITFLPGATVTENKTVMIEAGFTREEVEEAFSAEYDSPLFEGKPKSADLEGYIYGDTYKFNMGVTAKNVLEQVFSQFYSTLSQRRLDKGFEKRGFSLFEAITLASIIQRESGGGDEAEISQIFQTRLAKNMQLGSDVTYQYIADKTGVDRDVNLDSPYNTRRYTGLPPGPIATPGYEALKAVSLPAETEYLYFLSGDDDVTYYGKTLEEHEANIKKHCKEKCLII